MVAMEHIVCSNGWVNTKLARLSYNQLKLLAYLLSRPKAVTIGEIERGIKLKGKALGGVLSSLARTHYRGEAVIVPQGRAVDGAGLRWLLNRHAVEPKKTREEVRRLLSTY